MSPNGTLAALPHTSSPRERELRVPGVRVPGRGGGGGGAHGIVCDDTGLYCQTPVWSPNDDGTLFVETLVREPQADEVVPHVDVARHCIGRQGFAILI